MSNSFTGKKAVVVGGSRGLGLGMVEALVERGAQVSVVARGASALADVSKRLGVEAIEGDATDASLAERVLSRVRPEILIATAGVMPPNGGIRELSWEEFSVAWNIDAKLGFHWVQAALRTPLPRGARVLLGSSGAAVQGTPYSGGYAGAKRMLWLMASYANVESRDLDLGISFQAIVPLQMIRNTGVGERAAEVHARRRGVSVEAFLAGFGAPLSSRQVGEHVATILSDPAYANGVAFGLKGDTGITLLDPKASA